MPRTGDLVGTIDARRVPPFASAPTRAYPLPVPMRSYRLFAFAFGLVACQPGELTDRPEGPFCPDDETCSSATPDGLTFARVYPMPPMPYGSHRVDYPRPIALGAREALRFRDPLDRPLPAYDARSSLSLLSVTPAGVGLVVLEGVHEGEAYLRLTEPSSESLFDRIAVAVKKIDSVRVLPQEPASAAARYALMRDGQAIFVVGAASHDGDWLADDGLALEGTSAQSVNVLGLDGDRTLVARASDGTRGETEVFVVDRVDSVGLYDLRGLGGLRLESLAGEVPIDKPRVVCAAAWAQGSPVVGERFVFVGSANVRIDDSPILVGSWPSFACPLVTATGPGPATLSVHARGQSFTQTFTAVSRADDPHASPPPSTENPYAPMGERAMVSAIGRANQP